MKRHSRFSKPIRIAATLLLALTSAVGLVSAGEPTRTSAAEFLRIDPGARAASLGGAATASSGDAFAVLFNPAIAAGFRGVELAFDHNEWFGDLDQELLVALWRTRRFGVLGATLNRLAASDIRRTTVTSGQLGATTGTFDAGDYAFGVTWANRLASKLDAGISLKLVRSELDSRDDVTAAADLGIRFQALPNWSLGLSILNLGGELKLGSRAYDLPLSIRAGTALSLWDGRVTLAADAFRDRDRDLEAAVGAELRIGSSFLARAGYNSLSDDAGNGFSAGLGFRRGDLGLDYGFAPFAELEDAHRVSLRYRWAGSGASEDAR